MYRLTLTTDERRAFDWVGDRYATGHDWYKLLWGSCKQTPDDIDWDGSGEITFTIPEHVAWELNDLAQQEDWLFPCFSGELTAKLCTFCASIV
jgi:hypothetical protein